MTFTEFERRRYEQEAAAFIEKRRPPPHIRPQLDLGYESSGQSIEVFEIRPRWNHPRERMRHGVAKATYVKAKAIWRIYWMRSDLKWHRYGPMPEAESLQEFFAVVDEDEHGCFFG